MIIRPAVVADAPAMAWVLNDIIALGGTTAHEVARSADEVCADYVDGPAVLASVVAEDQGVTGWQSVGLWQGDAHIATFVQPGLQAQGVGTALFRATCDILRPRGVTTIIASIRADNAPGLAYYARIGFRDFAHDPGFALSSGQVVGRVHRRYSLV